MLGRMGKEGGLLCTRESVRSVFAGVWYECATMCELWGVQFLGE